MGGSRLWSQEGLETVSSSKQTSIFGEWDRGGNKKAAGGMFVNCGWEAVQGALRGGSEEQLLGLSADASSSGLGEGGWRGANPLSLL